MAEFLSEIDYEILTRNPFQAVGEYPMVIKDNIFPESSSLIYDELTQLKESTHLLQPSKMGQGYQENQWQSTLFRGDETCWITPSLCSERKMIGVQNIIKGMIKICSKIREYSQEPLALRDFSVQFAVYPGNDTGYTRHLDTKRVDDCSIVRRQITLIYYVHQEVNGGQLRVFAPNSTNAYLDIDPNPNRLVVFQSEVLEHEVLPTKSTRMALTMWASGSGRFGYFKPIDRPLLSPAVVTPFCSLQSLEVSWENLPTHLPNAHRDSSTLPLASDSRETIFVSIASYRDSELKYTIRDIFRQAQHPSRVFVGIVLQLFDTPEDQELYGIEQIYEASFLASCSNYLELAQLFHTNIRVLHLDAAESRGPCLARSLAQTLWKDEKFYFQIDSHMRLRPCYDSYLLQTYSQCEEILSAQVKNLPGDTHLFPVLSTYPPGYQLNDALPLTDIRSTVLVPSGFDADGMLRQKARLLKRIPTAPLLTHLWAAGFSFTEANAVMERVPYDPNLDYLFFGEEISMAARFFTHGGVFFTPPQSVVYHLWSRDHRPKPSSESEELKDLKKKLRIKSQQMVHDLLKRRSNDLLLPLYGLGSVRTLDEYEQLLNVSFQEMKMNIRDSSPLYPESIFADDLLLTEEPLKQQLPQQESKGQKKTKALNLAQSFLT